ncbi:MAG TPA: DMT family transporter [Opitutaceae bacterium]|nr:DMT family transporter [Opitutaceae bacterium]
MHWILASLVAALFLGIYELCTKHAVRANAVVPVLFLSSVCSATVWTALMVAGALAPGALPAGLATTPLDWWGHLQLAGKSALVASSWMFTYFAMKDLPVSITSPIRATGPIWTLAGALVVLGERPTALEWLGIGTTLASFVGLSFAGRGEGIRFHRDRAIGFMVAGTLLGAVSSLYDKYLLGTAGFTVPTVQAWFSVYLAVFFLPLVIGWKRRWWPRNEFHWRWSIPCIAAMLLVSDYLYFGALQDRDALVSLVSSLRRGSTLVAFTGGLLLFGEKNGLRKLPAVLGVMAGIVLTVFGRER